MLVADAASLDRLLELQAHDLHVDQLQHRRANLAARAELQAVATERASLAATLATLEATRGPLTRQQKAVDDEVARLREKIVAEDRRLYSGTVTSPKELQAIQDEINSLKRRVNELEDQELELMEQLEPQDAEADRIAADNTVLDGRSAAAAIQLAQDEAGVDAELAQVTAARDAARAGLTGDLLTHYTQLRKALGGVGVARLQGSRCEGCHLDLAAAEVDRLRRSPGVELAHCEECGRILVP